MKFVKIFLITIIMGLSFTAGMKFSDFKNDKFPKIIEDNIIIEEETTEPYKENNRTTENNKFENNNIQDKETKKLKSLETQKNDNIDVDESNVKDNIGNSPVSNEENAININEAEVDDNGGDTSINDGMQSDEVESGTIKRGVSRNINNR